jgi:hypothetical protein
MAHMPANKRITNADYNGGITYGISNDATAERCSSGTSGDVENDTAWKGAQKPGGKPASRYQEVEQEVQCVFGRGNFST